MFLKDNILLKHVFSVLHTICLPKRIVEESGHDQLLELRLLEKSAQHDFIIARQRSNNNIFSCQLLESS